MAADLRRELRAALAKAGLRADDAAVAADVANREMAERRDELIRAALAAGVSQRHVAAVMGISKSQVQRLASTERDVSECPVTLAKRANPIQRVQGGIIRTQNAPLLVTQLTAAEMLSLGIAKFRRLVKAGQAPAPVRISAGRVAWRVSDLQTWVNTREAA